MVPAERSKITPPVDIDWRCTREALKLGKVTGSLKLSLKVPAFISNWENCTRLGGVMSCVKLDACSAVTFKIARSGLPVFL